MYINYIAEQTLRRHYGTTTREDRPLVAGTDGKTNLLNPTNKYTSCFPNDFNGCLGCGSPDHCFRSCPRKDGKILKDDFSTRKKPIPPCVSSNPFIHPSIPPPPPPPLPLRPILWNTGATTSSNANSITWQQYNPFKGPGFFTLFARI